MAPDRSGRSPRVACKIARNITEKTWQWNVLAVEPLVLQRLERPLPHAVLAWRLDPGANVPQLGMGGDERGESKRPERAPLSVTKTTGVTSPVLCIGDSFKQRRAEKTRGFGDG